MKVKERKDMTKLRLNGGELNIAIDKNGNVLEFAEDVNDGYKNKWMLVLTAKELDQIAKKSRLLAGVGAKLKELIESIDGAETVSNTRETDHEITFNDDTYDIESVEFMGGVTFGCQDISAEDVASVHAISRKARGLKPIK